MLPHHISLYLRDEAQDQPGENTRHRMTETPVSPGEHDTPACYEIRLKGHLDKRWMGWFDGLSITHDSDGTTVLYGPVVDQAELHGLLRKVRDAGMTLISVVRSTPVRSCKSGK
jgi:hypothetical protein